MLFSHPIHITIHFVVNQLVISMESQGSPQSNNVVGRAIPNASTTEFIAQRSPIPPSPFFHGFGGAGNPMPFLYPHSFMPPPPGYGFGAPAQCTPSVTTNLSDGSPKRAPKESVIDLSNSQNKKRRAPRKKVEIVELDDTKDDLDLQKNSCHWKDHWVIHLITLRGEMQNTFSAPPKQGVLFFLFLFACFFISFIFFIYAGFFFLKYQKLLLAEWGLIPCVFFCT